MKTKSYVSITLVIMMLWAVLSAWFEPGYRVFASAHIENEWTYENSILVRCLPKPPRELGVEFNPYEASDFPEIEKWIEQICVIERCDS